MGEPRPSAHHIRGFEKEGEPSITVEADGSLTVIFNFMPPLGRNGEQVEYVIFDEFENVLSDACGVEVLRDDREVFVIAHPHADTEERLASFLSTFWKTHTRKQLRADTNRYRREHPQVPSSLLIDEINRLSPDVFTGWTGGSMQVRHGDFRHIGRFSLTARSGGTAWEIGLRLGVGHDIVSAIMGIALQDGALNASFLLGRGCAIVQRLDALGTSSMRVTTTHEIPAVLDAANLVFTATGHSFFNAYPTLATMLEAVGRSGVQFSSLANNDRKFAAVHRVILEHIVDDATHHSFKTQLDEEIAMTSHDDEVANVDGSALSRGQARAVVSVIDRLHTDDRVRRLVDAARSNTQLHTIESPTEA